jgi:prepilin-type N-terminal cleavage/methylation domain-containing protein
MRQKGFTLVEAAIAIGVVAILSGIIVPIVIKNLNDARIARARNDIAIIAGAIAHQLRDTGTRPRAATGDGGPTGLGNAMWFSRDTPTMPMVNPPPADPTDQFPAGVGNQNFTNLFSLAPSAARAFTLFGFAGQHVGNAPAGYQGPYMNGETAATVDPWGRSYLILGYNADGEHSHGPIWVVSAGASRSILAVNLTREAGVGGRPRTYPLIWDYADASATNIAVRVN